VQLHLLYVVDFMPFEKHSWFLSRSAQQATHDNRLCFANTVNASKNRHNPVNKEINEKKITKKFAYIGVCVACKGGRVQTCHVLIRLSICDVTGVDWLAPVQFHHWDLQSRLWCNRNKVKQLGLRHKVGRMRLVIV